MKYKFRLIIFFLFISLYVKAQKITFINPASKKKINFEKYDYVEAIIENDTIRGHAASFDNEFLHIRKFSGDSLKYEADTLKRSRHSDKMHSENWRYHGNYNGKHIMRRSTDIDTINFNAIDKLGFAKAQNHFTGGLELFILPLIALSSPIWDYENGKYQWEFNSVLLGISAAEWTYLILHNNRAKLKYYDLKDWQIITPSGISK